MKNAEWCLNNGINFTELTVQNLKGGGYGIKYTKTGKIIDEYNYKNKGTGFEIFRRWLEAEHVEQPILTDKEWNYLEHLIMPFRPRIIGIIKTSFWDAIADKNFYYIQISLSDDFATSLPRFPADSGEFKGMKANRVYSLEELKL